MRGSGEWERSKADRALSVFQGQMPSLGERAAASLAALAAESEPVPDGDRTPGEDAHEQTVANAGPVILRVEIEIPQTGGPWVAVTPPDGGGLVIGRAVRWSRDDSGWVLRYAVLEWVEMAQWTGGGGKRLQVVEAMKSAPASHVQAIEGQDYSGLPRPS